MAPVGLNDSPYQSPRAGAGGRSGSTAVEVRCLEDAPREHQPEGVSDEALSFGELAAKKLAKPP